MTTMNSSTEEDIRNELAKRKYTASEIEEIIPTAKTFLSLDFSFTTGLVLSKNVRQRKQEATDSVNILLRSSSKKVRTLGGKLMKRISEY